MIDVRVAYDDAVEHAGVERQIRVQLARLAAASQEEPRIEQEASPGGLEQVHGAGDLTAGGTPEGETKFGHVTRGWGQRVPKSRSPASPSPGRM